MNPINTNTILRSPDVAEGGEAVAETKGRIKAVNPATGKEEEAMIIPNVETGEEETYFLDGDGNPYIDRENGVRLTLFSFAGANDGLMYFSKSFVGVSAAVAAHGEAAVLAALNDSIRSGTARKVKRTKIPAYEDKNAQKDAIKKMKEKEPILFNQSEALAFVPGDKELSANQLTIMLKDKAKEGASKRELNELFQQLLVATERERQRKGIVDEDEDEVEA